MARQLVRVAAIAAALAVRTASSQENPPEVPRVPPPPESPRAPGSTQGGRPPGERPFRGGGEFPLREFANFVDSLPPEHREAVRQHFQEWQKKRAEQHKGVRPDSEEAKKFLERLPPEQREKFKDNLQRWQNMPSDERDALRTREEFRQRQIHQEVEKFLNESGLQLDGSQRDQFTRRYSQERRKIEEKLQQEMAEKRAPLVKEMAERLKAEFSSGGSATPAESKTPSANK